MSRAVRKPLKVFTSGGSLGDFILKYPLHLLIWHLSPPEPLPSFRNPSSFFSTIMATTPSPPGHFASAVPTVQVAWPH